MSKLTAEDLIEIEKEDEYKKELDKYRKKYKKQKEELDFADDDFEEDLMLEKMQKYEIKIRTLVKKLKNIEKLKIDT